MILNYQYWLTLPMLAVLPGLAMWTPAMASPTCASDTTLIEQSFASGASWAACARVDENHGIQLDAVHYRAPNDTLRQVLKTIHLGQILLHYHDQPEADVQLGQELNSNQNVNGRTLAMTSDNCNGDLLLGIDGQATLCGIVQNNRTLARYAQRPSLQSQNWELTSAFQRGSQLWASSVTLTEDGQITPALSLSGRANREGSDPRFAAQVSSAGKLLTRATVLSTWRMVFDLDTAAADRVFQFEFPLEPAQGNRRPMQITEITTEAFSNVHRENFRGWQVRDDSGAGYYLDPSNSGFSYRSSTRNWAQFDLAVTRHDDCERYAAANHFLTNVSSTDCGNSLDDFISGQTIESEHPVLWFSQSRSLNPSNEHWPVISNFYQSFTLLPFDWTSSSPFEVIE